MIEVIYHLSRILAAGLFRAALVAMAWYQTPEQARGFVLAGVIWLLHFEENNAAFWRWWTHQQEARRAHQAMHEMMQQATAPAPSKAQDVEADLEQLKREQAQRGEALQDPEDEEP